MVTILGTFPFIIMPQILPLSYIVQRTNKMGTHRPLAPTTTLRL